MRHVNLPVPAVILLFSLLLPIAAEAKPFGPGEAAGRRTARADFKVLVWYRYNDSIGTFKYEIYDLRKGEYTAKVDDWVKDVQTKHPAYYAVVRDVDLTREQGETDFLKVGSVISRELVVAAARAGVVIGSERIPAARAGVVIGSERIGSRPAGFGVFGASPADSSSPRSGSSRSPASSGGNRDYVKPSATPFPVPVPFPHVPR
jgi:hypothetical protein